jgi:hypothetical protein
MGKLRLVMHMQVNPGKQHISVHAKAAREGIGVDAVQSFVKREECLIELSLLGSPLADGYCPLEAVISLPAKLAVQRGVMVKALKYLKGLKAWWMEGSNF